MIMKRYTIKKMIVFIFIFISSINYGEVTKIEVEKNVEAPKVEVEKNIEAPKVEVEGNIEVPKIENNIESLIGVARSYIEKKELYKALKTYNKILKLDPDNKIAKKEKLILERNYVKTLNKNEKEAYLNIYEKHIIKEGFSNSNNIYTLGRLYLDNNKVEKAYDIFSKEINGDYRNYFGTAVAAKVLGRYDKAIEFYEKTLLLKPNFYKCYLDIGMIYKIKKDYDEAIRNMKIYISHKKVEKVYIEIADLYIIQKKYGDAVAILKDGNIEFPNSDKINKYLKKYENLKVN